MQKAVMYIRSFQKIIRTNDLSAYASSMAFFLFLSFIPILIILCSLLPFTPLTAKDLTEILIRVTPENMNPLMISVVNQVYEKSTGILSAAIVVAVWSAGKGMMALMRALNNIHGVEEKRGYFRLRLVASFYTIITLLIVLLTLCMGVFGKYLFQFLIAEAGISQMGVSLVERIREILVLGILFFFFLSIYSFVPECKLTIKSQLPGAVFTTCAWGVFSMGFALYVDLFSGFTAYGTLGTIILLLLWLYFCSYILLLGAVLNFPGWRKRDF